MQPGYGAPHHYGGKRMYKAQKKAYKHGYGHHAPMPGYGVQPGYGAPMPGYGAPVYGQPYYGKNKSMKKMYKKGYKKGYHY
jgi:hypothetical protein